MCIVTDGTERNIPEGATQLSFNGIARVWRGNNGYVYKRSIPFLINNEIYLLEIMKDSGYVPRFVTRYDKYTIRMEDIGRTERVTNKIIFSAHMYELRNILMGRGIRHGDLTRYAVVVKKNKPFLIDFSESRLSNDPRPDKRVEGDKYWIERTIDELTEGL